MGQIIDQAIRLYRRNFARFLGIAAIAQIPAALSGFLTTGASSMPFADQIFDEYASPMGGGTVFLSLTLTLVAAVWTQVIGCVLVQSASDTYFGQPTTLGVAFRRVGSSWTAVIAAFLLLFLFAMPLVILFMIPIVGWLLAIPGAGMFIYFATVIVAILPSVIVLERRGARPGIARAWDLARRKFWWLFGFFLLLSLFAVLLTQGPTYLLTGLLFLLGDGVLSAETMFILTLVVSSLFAVLFYPIQIASATLAYYDTRIRYEGLDLALQTLMFEDDGSGVSDGLNAVDQVIRHPPPDHQRFRPTRGEWGAFSLITLGLGGLMILLLIVVAAIDFFAFPGF